MTLRQAESFRIALAGIADTLAQFQKYIKDSISSSLQSFSLVMNEVKKSLDVNIGKMLSNIDYSRLVTIEEDELNDENDEEDNEESPS